MPAKPGSVIYGSDKEGSDIYKDSKGYYVIRWNPKTDNLYKKYLKSKMTRKKIAKLRCTRKNKGCKWVLV